MTSPEPEIAAQFFAKSTAAAFGCEGTRVALQTRNGKNYLTALAGGGFGVAATATTIDRFEKFKVWDMGFGRIALQAPNGRYVGWGGGQQNGQRQQNGQQQVNVADYLLSANTFSVDQRSLFRVSRPKDSEWLFVQTVDGRFVSAVGGGGSLVDVAWPFPGENQQLKAVCVDAPDTSDEDGWNDSTDSDDDSGWNDSTDDTGWNDDDVSSGRPGLGD